MKCTKCSADVAGKFCPEDGTKIEEPTLQKSVCPACSAEQVVGGKFCMSCSAPISPSAATDEEITAAMSAIDTLAKSSAALTDDITFVPSEETRTAGTAGDPTRPPTETAGEAEGEGAGMDLMKALLDTHNFIVDMQAAVGKEARAARKDVGVLAKSQASILGVLKSLTAKVEALSSARPGSRSAQVIVNQRHTAGSPPGAGEADPNDIKGLDLVAKATTCASLRDNDGQPLLLAGEIARVEQWAHAGGSLKSIAAMDSALGHRMERAFQTLQRKAN